MCCGEKHRYGDAPEHNDGFRAGAHETCGCEDKGHSSHVGFRESCCCGGHKSPSRNERESMLEEQRKLLKSELERIEGELKELSTE